VAAAVAGLALAGLAAPAAASLPNDNWSCQNPAGNEVHGQCQGVPLEVVNPGGNVPPGQN
jgi:hypothetical protein